MSASNRVRQLVTEVRKLSEDERAELEAELFADDPAVASAWGEEIDRRAERVLGGDTSGLSRDHLTALLAMTPADARAHLSKILASRR
jgi:hypothetical protein